MYDMYPEWGPAHLDEDHPGNPANWSGQSAPATATATVTAPVQESIDLRDNGGARPDDNERGEGHNPPVLLGRAGGLRSRSRPMAETMVSQDERSRQGGRMSDVIKLAVIGGDGIGPEVTAEAVKALDAVAELDGLKVEQTDYTLGAEHWKTTGEVLSDETLAGLRVHDAILLGAVGGRPGDLSLPPGLLERGLLLRLRFELDHYVNLRPSRVYPGVPTPLADPGDVDFVVVREGTEGAYVGTGGRLRSGTPAEVATEVSVNTAYGVERVVRDAFARAQRRPRRRLTWVHKKNVLVHAGSLWSRVVAAVAAEHPDVEVDYLHVDAATILLTTDPARFDVIVTDNLFGDILTDLAGAVTGGIGLAASGNINPDGTAPSMFEPVHGSAPDIAGQGIADPTAAILSTALLLDHLGHSKTAARIDQAVADDVTANAGGRRRKTEVGDSICSRLVGTG